MRADGIVKSEHCACKRKHVQMKSIAKGEEKSSGILARAMLHVARSRGNQVSHVAQVDNHDTYLELRTRCRVRR